MTLLRDLKQTVTNEIEDATKFTKLAAVDIKEQLTHEVRQGQMEQTKEDMAEGYNHIKQSVKNYFK